MVYTYRVEKRKIFAITVFAVGVIGALLVLNDGNASTSAPEISIGNGSGSAGRFAFPGFDATEKTGGSGLSGSNFTNQLAQLYLQGFVNENPDGPQLLNGAKGLKAPSITDQLSDPELLTRAAASLKATPFTEKDVRKLASENKLSAGAYFSAVAALEEKDFPKGSLKQLVAALDGWMANQSTDQLDAFSVSAQRYTEHLLTIPVPPSLAAFHVRMLDAWMNAAMLSSALTELGTDPLKALVAFQQIPAAMETLKTIEQSVVKQNPN